MRSEKVSLVAVESCGCICAALVIRPTLERISEMADFVRGAEVRHESVEIMATDSAAEAIGILCQHGGQR